MRLLPQALSAEDELLGGGIIGGDASILQHARERPMLGCARRAHSNQPQGSSVDSTVGLQSVFLTPLSYIFSKSHFSLFLVCPKMGLTARPGNGEGSA